MSSWTSGEPKVVPFTLQRLVESGWILASSIGLGLGVMPLHHMECIACNCNATSLLPNLQGGAWSTWRTTVSQLNRGSIPLRGEVTASPGGATWCYVAPTIWGS